MKGGGTSKLNRDSKHDSPGQGVQDLDGAHHGSTMTMVLPMLAPIRMTAATMAMIAKKKAGRMWHIYAALPKNRVRLADFGVK